MCRVSKFHDYTDMELLDILHWTCKKDGFRVTEEAASKAIQILSKRRMMPGFGNARNLKSLLAEAKKRACFRPGQAAFTLEEADFTDGTSPEAADKEIKELFNAQYLIDEIEKIKKECRAYQLNGLDSNELLMNYKFVGPPVKLFRRWLYLICGRLLG